MLSVWEKQFDRLGVDPRLYDKLYEMAVDYRMKQIGRDAQPTPLTAELLMACYLHYKQITHEEHQRLKVLLDSIRSTKEMVANGQKSREVGLADLLTVSDIPESVDMDFDELATQVIDKLQSKYDGFLQEKYLEGEDEASSSHGRP